MQWLIKFTGARERDARERNRERGECMCVMERERGNVCNGERERVCMFLMEREREWMCVMARESVREKMRTRERERSNVPLPSCRHGQRPSCPRAGRDASPRPTRRRPPAYPRWTQTRSACIRDYYHCCCCLRGIYCVYQAWSWGLFSLKMNESFMFSVWTWLIILHSLNTKDSRKIFFFFNWLDH